MLRNNCVRGYAENMPSISTYLEHLQQAVFLPALTMTQALEVLYNRLSHSGLKIFPLCHWVTSLVHALKVVALEL